MEHKNCEQDNTSDTVDVNIAEIVQEAVADSSVRNFSRIPFLPSRDTSEGGRILRKYFGSYLQRLIRELKKAKAKDIEDMSKSIDSFLSDTWMNQLLDSSVDTYVIRDYLIELSDLVLAGGGKLERLPQWRLEHLSQDWEKMSQGLPTSPRSEALQSEALDRRDALEEVIKSMPKSV